MTARRGMPWSTVRRWWVRAGLFSLAALPVYAWYTYAPRIDPAVLASDARVVVQRDGPVLRFVPAAGRRSAGLLWVAGCLVPAEAYAPMARSIAAVGYPTVVYALPWRCAPLPSQRAQVLADLRALMTEAPGRWVLGGHSKGAVFVSAVAAAPPAALHGIVLAGTTHPRDVDLSGSRLDVAKVSADRDGIAPLSASLARRALLPPDTHWQVIEGGNHSQFGWYGTQLGDGTATITRERQQAVLRAVTVAVLERAATGAPAGIP